MSVQEVASKLSVSDSWKDTFVRASKTAVATLITALPLNQVASYDIATLKIVGLSAAAAGGSVLLNRVLVWLNS